VVVPDPAFVPGEPGHESKTVTSRPTAIPPSSPHSSPEKSASSRPPISSVPSASKNPRPVP
jgi:hypothetical protein